MLDPMRDALAYLAAGILAAWGVIHVVPTRQVVTSMEPSTSDSRLVITQEWIVEALAMWGLATLVIATAATATPAATENWIYRVTAAIVAAITVLTAFTGARTPVVWFKICLVVLATVVALLLGASFA
jgi:hypothetical protein